MLILDCSGTVELTSSAHNFMKILYADRWQKRKITMRFITARHPETRTRLSFEIVKITGDCAWTVHENKSGGRKKRMADPKTIVPGWSIRRVTLLEE